jgi:hypothetical protein
MFNPQRHTMKAATAPAGQATASARSILSNLCPRRLRQALLHLGLASALVLPGVLPGNTWARGESEAASVVSGLSIGVPIASAAAGAGLVLSAGVGLTVVAVQVASTGTLWVLERASDGARIVLRLSATGAQAVSVGVGTAVLVTATSTGWLLSAAGEVICFVPNELGAALIHHERISQ